MKKIFLVFAVLSFLAVACYYDSEEVLYPQVSDTCDTTNVTFSTTISALLANNCYTCHSNSSAATFGNGIALEDYADVKNRADAVLGSIKHEAAYSPMPKGGGVLNDCLIREMEAWVNAGTPDN